MFTIHSLTTGTVNIKQSMQRGVGTGLRRRSGLFRPSPFTGPLPIHVWAIEHDDGLILVDAGEASTAHEQAFAKFDVTREQELDHALRGAGLDPDDVTTVVLTHIHGDHIGGLPHVPKAKVLASAAEVAFTNGLGAKLTRRALHQPLPPGFHTNSISFDGPAFGAFAVSAPITA